jgi:ribonuclease P protein component
MPRSAPSLDATGKFPRTARVRRRREFTRIQGEGIRVHTDAFTIVLAPATTRARLGLTVSKRVGNAVVRNRLRRLLREIFRRRAATMPSVDLVIIAKPDAARFTERGLQPLVYEILPAIDSAIAKLEARGRRKERA